MEEQIENEKKRSEFITAYDAFGDAIFRYCYLRVFDRESAKELVQDVFVRVWKYVADGKKIDNIRAFLYRTARNLIIDKSRKKTALSLDYLQEKGVMLRLNNRNGHERDMDDKIEAKEAISAISSLETLYKDVLVMRYVEEFSVKEIAEILGESENTISVRIHRGLGKVREILKV